MSTHPWILFLDSDEEVSPDLREEILREFERGTGRYFGYEFPRQVYYLGKWIRHGEWFPDVKLRLFKKDHGRTEGQEPHDKVVVNGPVKRLRNPIWHYTYDDIRDHLETLNRFSTITAQQRFVQGDGLPLDGPALSPAVPLPARVHPEGRVPRRHARIHHRAAERVRRVHEIRQAVGAVAEAEAQFQGTARNLSGPQGAQAGF